MKKIILLLAFALVSILVQGQTTCPTLVPFCGNTSAQGGQSLIYQNEYNNGNGGDIACLASTPNPKYFYFKIDDTFPGGSIDFNIIQNTLFNAAGDPIGTPLDVDFAAWGPFDYIPGVPPANSCGIRDNINCPSCPNNTTNPGYYPAGNLADCSWDAATQEVMHLNSTGPGKFYIVLVTNYSNQPGFIKLEVSTTSAGTTPLPDPANQAYTDCDIVCGVNVGPDQTECAGTPITMTATFATAALPGTTTFQWSLNGVPQAAYNTPNNQQTITVTQAGTWSVKATRTGGCADATDSMDVIYYDSPTATNNPIPLNICVPSGTAAPYVFSPMPAGPYATINQNTLMLASIPVADRPDYAFTYYTTSFDANNQTGVNTISLANQANYSINTTSQTIWVGIERVSTGCYMVKSFTLNVFSGGSGSFSYPSSGYCTNVTSAIPTANAPGMTPGGVYQLSASSPTPTGLVFTNTATGEINPSLSAPGTYAIEYFISGVGACSAYTSPAVNVTITTTPVLQINQPAGVCAPNTVDLTAPAITAGSIGGGVLSYWTNSAATIPMSNPSAATTGIYYIKSTSGTCSDIKSVSVTINPGSSLTLTSAAGTTNQNLCINSTLSNITYTVGGSATSASVVGLPAGVSGSYSGGLFTISGTPTVTGTFNYTVTTSGGCTPDAQQMGTISVTLVSGINLTSPAATDNQTVCQNTAIANITYGVSGGVTGVTISSGALPAGVTGSLVGSTYTISGTPSVSGTFNYVLTTSGGCAPDATISGSIIVKPLSTLSISVPSTAIQSICVNTALASTSYNFGGSATGAAITAGALPAGVTGNIVGSAFVISGTPTVTGTFNYTVSTTGGCLPAVSLSGTITVNPVSSIVLTSVAATDNQTVCQNTAIANITYGVAGGVIGVNISSGALPAGVTGSLVGSTYTISGTPSVSGTFNYTLTTSGGCAPNATISGSIIVKPLSTLSISIPSTAIQSICVNTALASTSYNFGGSATGAAITTGALPAGVTGNIVGSAFVISGTPTATGTFNYTVSTTGGCLPAVSLSGTITVNPVSSIVLSSPAATDNQTVCQNTAIANITYGVAGGVTGVAISSGALPAGVTGSLVGSTYTISGTPTVSGTFNYTLTTSGGCAPNATISGSIIVKPLSTLSISVPSTATQSICVNTALTAIQYNIGGSATGIAITTGALPTGVTGNLVGSVYTISGTPTATGTFNYTVSTTGGCLPAVSLSGTITVNPASSIVLTSVAATDNQTVCQNTAIANITYGVAGGVTGVAISSGALPAGVSGNLAGSTYTISGTPSVSGTFNYTITTSGGCAPNATISGSIIVKPLSTLSISVPSTATQSICVNTALTAIQYNIGGSATGIAITTGVLPTGVTGNLVGSVYTISGTPTATGTFNYTVSTTGGCLPAVSLSGTITVNPASSIVLSSPTTTNNQTVCQNTSLATITYSVAGGVTGASITAGSLPTGVTGNFGGNTFTITGTPSIAGVFNYTITTSGGCAPDATISGSITVTIPPTLSLTSAAGSDAQEICVGSTTMNAITYSIGGSGTGAAISAGSLPTGVTGNFAGGVFTISGTPTVSGTFNYTVSTTGGCTPGVSLTGSIKVNPKPKPVLHDDYMCIDATGNGSYTLDTGMDDTTFDFQWFNMSTTPPTSIGTTNTVTISTPGNYGVIVTDVSLPTNCPSDMVTVTISPLSAPQSIVHPIETSDYFAEVQTVTVTVIPTGVYEYQIDNGNFQNSNVFTNVGSGTHTIIVRNECGTLPAETVNIVDYPKFFTPNGDGYHDTWNIPAISGQAKAKIDIFDRFGKLLKEIQPSTGGWDGTFNQKDLPSTDYWFVVYYNDKNNISKEFRAHFALKR